MREIFSKMFRTAIEFFGGKNIDTPKKLTEQKQIKCASIDFVKIYEDQTMFEVVRSLKLIFQALEAYVGENKHTQSIRVTASYDIFLAAYRQSTLGDLPVHLDKLLSDLQSVAKL